MTAKLAIIGANGKVATRLVERLGKLTAEFDTTAFIRSEEQAPKFDQLGIKWSTKINITDSSLTSIADTLKGFDAVVFSAGAGGKGLEYTFSVDLDGAVKVAEAVERNRTKRFILVSAIKSEDRDFWWDGGIRSYYIAKKYADEIVKNMDIDWTILQPGRLLDTESLGKVMDPSKVNEFASSINVRTESEKIAISRDDVALAIIESLRQKSSVKKIIPLVSGDVDITDAIKSL